VSDVILASTQSIAHDFSWIDWSVVLGYLAVTTLLGGLLAGRQATIRDFFLGGRKLPWPAVAGSIIATEISAVTFVGVPAIAYASGGNMTYFQLGVFGMILSRIIVGYVFVPAYYAREIYSPYDYMGNQLGGQVRTMTTCLFSLGGMLAQGVRVYLTAVVLDLIVGESFFGRIATATGTHTITWSIIVIGLVAIAWTLMGGITTVIWTDVLLFLVFFIGGIIALVVIVAKLPGDMFEGFRTFLDAGLAAEESGPWGKFTFFDFDRSPAANYTIWTATIAATWIGLGSFGTDQLMAQRMFCCKSEREARKAIILSGAGQIIAALMLLVGIGLFVFYKFHPLDPQAIGLLKEEPNRIFPIFIIQQLPTGITGLLIAGIFAAAISSLDSILAALSQTTISAFYLPWRRRRGDTAGETDHHVVFLSRVLVVVWGILLCVMAYVAIEARDKFPMVVDLALSMASYTWGALLAGFLLAFLKLPIDGRGFMWAAPMSVLMVFAVVWHDPSWTRHVCWITATVLLISWLWYQTRWQGARIVPPLAQTCILVAGLAMILLVNYFGYLGTETEIDPETGQKTIKYVTIAWPWLTPIGSIVAFAFGCLLAGRKGPAVQQEVT
jgi:SSS family transporter